MDRLTKPPSATATAASGTVVFAHSNERLISFIDRSKSYGVPRSKLVGVVAQSDGKLSRDGVFIALSALGDVARVRQFSLLPDTAASADNIGGGSRRTRPLRQRSRAQLIVAVSEAQATRCQALWRAQLARRRHRLAKKRFFASKSALENESEYVKNLTTLYTGYYLPMQSSIEDCEAKQETPPLSTDELRRIFSNFSSLLSLHDQMMIDLKPRIISWHIDQRVGDLYLKTASMLRLYTSYVEHFDEAQETLAMASSRPAFTSLLRSCQQRVGGIATIDLSSLLIAPVQRLPKLLLVLDELLVFTPRAHVDYDDLLQARDMVKNCAEFVNDNKHESENLRKLLVLQSKLAAKESAAPPPLAIRGREIIHFSQFHNTALILCNDLLLYIQCIKPSNSNEAASKGGSRTSTPTASKHSSTRDLHATNNDILPSMATARVVHRFDLSRIELLEGDEGEDLVVTELGTQAALLSVPCIDAKQRHEWLAKFAAAAQQLIAGAAAALSHASASAAAKHTHATSVLRLAGINRNESNRNSFSLTAGVSGENKALEGKSSSLGVASSAMATASSTFHGATNSSADIDELHSSSSSASSFPSNPYAPKHSHLLAGKKRDSIQVLSSIGRSVQKERSKLSDKLIRRMPSVSHRQMLAGVITRLENKRAEVEALRVQLQSIDEKMASAEENNDAALQSQLAQLRDKIAADAVDCASEIKILEQMHESMYQHVERDRLKKMNEEQKVVEVVKEQVVVEEKVVEEVEKEEVEEEEGVIGEEDSLAMALALAEIVSSQVEEEHATTTKRRGEKKKSREVKKTAKDFIFVEDDIDGESPDEEENEKVGFIKIDDEDYVSDYDDSENEEEGDEDGDTDYNGDNEEKKEINGKRRSHHTSLRIRSDEEHQQQQHHHHSPQKQSHPQRRSLRSRSSRQEKKTSRTKSAELLSPFSSSSTTQRPPPPTTLSASFGSPSSSSTTSTLQATNLTATAAVAAASSRPLHRTTSGGVGLKKGGLGLERGEFLSIMRQSKNSLNKKSN